MDGISMPSAEVSKTLIFTPPYLASDGPLCERFGIAQKEQPRDDQWQLTRTLSGALALRSPMREGPISITLDPSRGDLARRLRTARPDQPLPRAIGLHRRATPPRVLDATAGLGRDCLLLARLGCEVTACEQNAALAALLFDVAERSGLAHQITVHCGDAIALMAAISPADRPDIVYLDPMFEFSSQSQVKKEMQVCRLLAEDGDTSLLLHAAFAVANDRVVVKRHPHLQPLRELPSFTVNGERVRFDVYLQVKS